MCVCMCVWGRGDDWEEGFMYASCVDEGASRKAYVCAQGEREGWFQKSELSCICTSSNTPHGSINPFLSNTLLMFLMTSRGIER